MPEKYTVECDCASVKLRLNGETLFNSNARND
jgi:hypothetical protein